MENTNKNYNTNQNIFVDISNVNQNDLNGFYKTTRAHFQNKMTKKTWIEHCIYNVIRNKPLFYGIHAIRWNTLYEFGYMNSFSPSAIDDQLKTHVRYSILLETMIKEVGHEQTAVFFSSIIETFNNKTPTP